MRVADFGYPLRFADLGEFCHPLAGHVFGAPAFVDGQAWAGNGYVLIRVHRGLWMESDFEEVTPEFGRRFLAAPWRDHEAGTEWRAMEEIQGSLRRYGPISPWLKGRCAPSPVWRVGGAFLGRVSHLQLIARLPRCEVVVPRGRAEEAEPLFFRFSGGCGMLAHDRGLREASFEVWTPAFCFDGHEVRRERVARPNFGKPPPEDPGIEGWPPAEAM